MLNINASLAFSSVHAWRAGNKRLDALMLFSSLSSISFCRCYYNRRRLAKNDAIVVTGCDSGLGFSLALHCRNLGANVIASVLEENGTAVNILKKRNIIVHPLDLTIQNNIDDFVNTIDEHLTLKNQQLRALVNNAGVMVFGEMEWQTDEQISRQVAVNLLGVMRLTRRMMPIIRKDSSRIVFVSSHCAQEALPGVSVYSATKSALAAWATSIRVELKKYGIQVVSFVPGSFIQESNILAKQAQYFERMEAEMTTEMKNFYGDYFKRYSEYFRPMAHTIAPKELSNRKLYKIFEDALLHTNPLPIYKCEPWRYFFYYSLFKITPTRVRDLLVEKFVQLPLWRDNRKNTDKKV